MMAETFDDAWFDRALQDVDVTAPSELRAAISQMVSRDRRSMTHTEQRPPRRWRLAVSVAATIVVVVGGLALLGQLGGDPEPVPTDLGTDVPPADSTPSTPASTIESDVAPPVTTATNDTELEGSTEAVDQLLATMGLTEASTLSGDDAFAALSVLNDYRIEILRNSPGFSGTSRFGQTWVLADGSKPNPDNPPTVAEVTVLANGDAWAEFANGDLFRRDGPAGIDRGLYDVDGQVVAWELSTFPNAHGFDRAIGHDPMRLLGGLEQELTGTGPPGREPGTIAVSEVQYEQRRAVEVRIDSEWYGNSRMVIDLASGLIVEQESPQDDETRTPGSYSSLSDVTEADQLPVTEFPPLPDGVQWTQLGGQPRDTTATIGEASQAFGSGLMLPSAVIESGVVVMNHSGLTSEWTVVEPGDPDVISQTVSLNYVEPVGLLRTSVYLHTERPAPDGSIPPGYIPVDDRICLEPCPEPDPNSSPYFTPTVGALAGVPISEWGINLDGIFLAITAPTRDDALAIANSFVAVSDG